MASNVTNGCGGLAFIFLTLHVVSLATPSWFIIFYDGKTLARAGLFIVCLEEGGLCVSYGDIMFRQGTLPFSYIAYVGLNLLGCLCNLIFMIRCIYHACYTPAQQRSSLITIPAVAWFFAAGFLIASVVWFFISLMSAKTQLSAVSSISSISVDPGYSFYLACVTGAAYLISAIFLTIYVRRLAASNPPNAVVTGHPQITGNPQVIVMQTGNQPIANTGNSSTAALGHSIPPPEYSKKPTGGYPSGATGAYPNGATGVYPNSVSGGYPYGVSGGYPQNVPRGNFVNYELGHNNPAFTYDK